MQSRYNGAVTFYSWRQGLIKNV